MKSRLVMLMSLAIAALSVVIAGSRLDYSTTPPPPAHASLPHKPASYLGVYEDGAPPSYQPIKGFANAAERRPDLVGYFSGWAEPFNTGFAQVLHSHDITPLVQIDPTDANVGAIADGAYDVYLTQYADAVRDFRHPVVIGFGQEMNAPWYPWGYGHGLSPQTFVAAWQHIVNVFRGQGADNVTWMWTVQAVGGRAGAQPISAWWPGNKYVSWVGIDGFYYQPSDTFVTVFADTIDEVRSLTVRPILLAETAVGPNIGQFHKIQDLFRGMAHYGTLGLVWFDFNQQELGGPYAQDWRIEGNQNAEFSFRLGVQDEIGPGPTATTSPNT